MSDKSNATVNKSSDFSMVLGGPLYQLYLRTRLARAPLELLHRRTTAFAVITWLPPLLLSAWAGTVFSGVEVPFFHDIATHARFLIALPIMILAEYQVHYRISPLIEQFSTRELIAPAEQARFDAALKSAHRLRNSIWIETALLLICFSWGHKFWLDRTSIKATTWYAVMTPGGLDLTPAGLWYSWVSMPLFQFVFFRWYFRLFIWARFLWQVSRIPLRLIPTHPDRTGGLGFLTASVPALAPILIGQSTVLAGVMAGKIFFEGSSLMAFKLDMATITAFQAIVVLGPLCVFIPQLARARRRGWEDYGALAMRYVDAFDQKWNRHRPGEGEKLLGSADIQSLADMGNSYNVVQQMKLVPLNKEAVLQVIAAALLPIAPLILTVVPLDELVRKLLRVLF